MSFDITDAQMDMGGGGLNPASDLECKRHNIRLTSKNVAVSIPVWPIIDPVKILEFLNVPYEPTLEPLEPLSESAGLALRCFAMQTICGMRTSSKEAIDCLSEEEWEKANTTQNFTEFTNLVELWATNYIKKIETGVIDEPLHEYIPGQPFFPRNHEGVVKACVKRNGMVLKVASKILQDAFEIVSTAVDTDGMALKYASPRLKNNESIALQAIANSPAAIQYVSAALRNNLSFSLKAIRMNGLVLKYIKPVLPNGIEVRDTWTRISSAINSYYARIGSSPSTIANPFRMDGGAVAVILENLCATHTPQKEEQVRLLDEMVRIFTNF